MAANFDLVGKWAALEPINSVNRSEVEDLDRRRESVAAMGGTYRRTSETAGFGPPVAIRSTKSKLIVGTIDNYELAGYPGVAGLNIYVDRSIGRAGLAVEAFALYVAYLFQNGASVIHMEVLSFNIAVIKLLAKMNLHPQATLRQHAFVASGNWDVLVFSFTAEEWDRTVRRYGALFPSGRDAWATVKDMVLAG